MHWEKNIINEFAGCEWGMQILRSKSFEMLTHERNLTFNDDERKKDQNGGQKKKLNEAAN